MKMESPGSRTSPISEPTLALPSFLAPPVFQGDPQKTRRAYFANIAWLAFFGSALAAVFGGMVGNARPMAQAIHLLAVALCVPMRAGLSRGHVDGVARASLVFGWTAITVLLVLVGTIRTPALGFYIVLVNGAGVMLGFRAMAWMIVVVAATVAALIVAPKQAWLPPAEVHVGMMQWVVSVAMVGAAGGLTHACLRFMGGALTDAELEIVERKSIAAELVARNAELARALEQVKTLTGLLPVCGWCRKVRADDGYWDQLESYVSARTDATFTHGICPDCRHEHFPSPQAGKPAN